MANISTDAFQSSADLSLWLKLRSGDALTLADVPEIVPMRWAYLRDTWPTLRRSLLNLADSQPNPDYFRAALEDMDSFVDMCGLNTTGDSPLSGSAIYYRFYPLFNALLVEQIGLTNEESELVDRKQTAIQSLSKNDFLKIKRNIIAYRDSLADAAGLGDPDYNRIYSRGTAISQLVPRITDLNLMQVLQDQVSAVDFILANLFAVDAAIDPFALARLNANNTDVQIGQYNSGYMVKLHYGEDLQGLATRYLGDPNKWIDIAIANGLREPYVDEVGEQLFLLSNGRGSQINIRAADLNGQTNLNKLYINQPVLVQSNTMPFPDQRSITGLREVPVSGEIVLTLSGEANLDMFLLADGACIRIFKPNTVNSSQFVLIPTPAPLANTRDDEIPWFMTRAGADEKKAKIDLAVNEDGSLQFTSNGDVALSYGLANAIQAVRLKLSTEQGSNRYHKEYGLINVAGTRNLPESEVRNTLIDSINTQIQADTRFDRVESLRVDRVSPSTSSSAPVAYGIDLVVRMAGSNTLLPISFTVNI